MKAMISATGGLQIRAENPTESYALKMWWDKFCENAGATAGIPEISVYGIDADKWADHKV